MTHLKSYSSLTQLIASLKIFDLRLGYDREKLRLTRHSSFRRSNSPMPATRMQQSQQGHKISSTSSHIQSADSSSQFSTSTENRHTNE